MLYELVRRWHCEGDDEAADKYLDEIRTELIALDNALKEESPDEWDDAEVGMAKDIRVDSTMAAIQEAVRAHRTACHRYRGRDSPISGCEALQGMR